MYHDAFNIFQDLDANIRMSVSKTTIAVEEVAV